MPPPAGRLCEKARNSAPGRAVQGLRMPCRGGMGRAHRARRMRTSLLLVMCLAGAPALAAAPVTAAQARAEVAQKTRQMDVLLAARARLLDERAALQQRADALAVQVADAKRNRSVLSDPALKGLLRDSLEVGKQLEASDRKLAALDRRIVDGETALEQTVARVGGALSREDRTQAESDVQRYRSALPRPEQAPSHVGVSASSTMDPEALRERADLAGDYEEKLRKEVARTEARIRELGEQQSVAGEAQLLSADRRLFDEDDRALRASRVQRSAEAVQATGNATGARNNTGAAAGGGPQAATDNASGNGMSAAPENPSFTGAENDGDRGGSAGNAPPPALGGSAATASAATGRSQTIVDERTFALLRESRTPTVAASPADELRRLQARREALIRAAARMKAVREELSRQAQSKPAQ